MRGGAGRTRTNNQTVKAPFRVRPTPLVGRPSIAGRFVVLRGYPGVLTGHPPRESCAMSRVIGRIVALLPSGSRVSWFQERTDPSFGLIFWPYALVSR